MICFRKEPRFSNGLYVAQHAVRAFYMFIDIFGTLRRFNLYDGVDRFLCHLKKLFITRSNTSFAGQLKNSELGVTFGGCLGEYLSTQNVVHET